MYLPSLIGPAVVAAVIAAIVSVIGLLINRATVRGMHTERLATDRELAERRSTAELALAERKFEHDRDLADRKASADEALAERRFRYERDLSTWKRRVEFAEEVLADFYQAREIINAARSPGSMGGEGSTRQKENWETDDDTRTLNAYFATTERLTNKREFFAQLHARRYRFIATFGQRAVGPYDDLHKVYVQIVIAVRMLVSTHRNRSEGTLPAARREWEGVIWEGLREDDPIPARLNLIIEAIEETCRRVLEGATE